MAAYRRLGVFVLVWGMLAAACAPSAKRKEPPNVILISVDTLRADAVGAYGGPLNTPALDSLAADGVRVITALAPSPETSPSHATLISGRHISTHGVKQNRPVPFDMMPLASAFAEAGYFTAGVVSSYVMSPHFGWDRGFDRFDAEFSEEQGSQPNRLPAKLRRFFDGIDRLGPYTTRIAASWLREIEEPFFLFVHYFDPHWPYTFHDNLPEVSFDMKGRSGPPAKLQRWRRYTRAYYSEVLYLDKALGELLEVVDARGLRGNTLVVLTADHGEGLGQHGWLTHTAHLYEEQIRVPLLLRWPGTLPAALQLEVPVGLVDVAPTIAELAGVELAEPVDGRSFAQAAQGRGEPDARPVLGLRRKLNKLRVEAMGERYYVRTARWKYIRGMDGPEELYDLKADPLELTNQAAEHPDVVAQLSAYLDAHHQEYTPSSARPELTEEQIEALEALGYIE